ncbi:MAG: hypothetical protein MSH25_02300 [Desulfovibrio sp.]|uniref:hypothetical protein n=1 Tax=Desulfovibrio sp. TaxID=885 RepID=UPI0025BB8CE9|nr:hypothetical protein [Desulfovibrio sp.]MCI7568193.1 hypothetical protein [Desulfovibrio sp.]
MKKVKGKMRGGGAVPLCPKRAEKRAFSAKRQAGTEKAGTDACICPHGTMQQKYGKSETFTNSLFFIMKTHSTRMPEDDLPAVKNSVFSAKRQAV